MLTRSDALHEAAVAIAKQKQSLLFDDSLDGVDSNPQLSALILQAVAAMDLAMATLRLAAIEARKTV